MMDIRRRMMTALALGGLCELYMNGDSCDDTTGGWARQNTSVNNGTLELRSTYMRFYNSETYAMASDRVTLAMTQSKIRTRRYSKLCVTYSAGQISGDSSIVIALYSAKSSSYRSYKAYTSAKIQSDNSTQRTLTLNISGITDDLYVGIFWETKAGTDENHILFVHRVWLE